MNVHISATKYFLIQLLFWGGLSEKRKGVGGLANITEEVYNPRRVNELGCWHYQRNNSANIASAEKVICKNGAKYCFAALSVSLSVNKSVIDQLTVLKRGCWPETNPEGTRKCAENRNVCSFWKSRSDEGRTHTVFCCCSGSFCNNNFTYVNRHLYGINNSASPGSSPQPQSTTLLKPKNPVILGIISSVFVLTLAMIIVFVGRKCAAHRKNVRILNPKPVVDKSKDYLLSVPLINEDHILLGDILHTGHFSTVRKAIYEGHVVAAKIFNNNNLGQWHNEHDVYKILGDHPNVVKFIAAFQFPRDDVPQGMLLLEYYPNGSLLQFLRERALNWDQMCKLALSLANGVAYVHGEINEYDHGERTVIVHRDLNSRNVLVNHDGTCSLVDFGFALHIVGCQANPTAEVGTIRYMPPEILGGAVNWRDCEASLKQADVYALGLVLWEIVRRCQDVYTDPAVPEAKLPYEEELGSHPGADKVHELVVHQLKRPSFLEEWNDSDMACHLLRDTIEECWDQEPQARLTALCVVRRIQEVINSKGKKAVNRARKCDSNMRRSKHDSSTQTVQSRPSQTGLSRSVEGERKSSSSSETDVGDNLDVCDCGSSAETKRLIDNFCHEKKQTHGCRNKKKKRRSDLAASSDLEYCSLQMCDEDTITLELHSHSLPCGGFVHTANGKEGMV